MAELSQAIASAITQAITTVLDRESPRDTFSHALSVPALSMPGPGPSASVTQLSCESSSSRYVAS